MAEDQIQEPTLRRFKPHQEVLAEVHGAKKQRPHTIPRPVQRAWLQDATMEYCGIVPVLRIFALPRLCPIHCREVCARGGCDGALTSLAQMRRTNCPRAVSA